VGKSFSMRVNSEGQILDIYGLEEMKKAVINSMNLNEDMKIVMGSSFNQEFYIENIRQSFSQAFNFCPNKIVRVGDSWDKKIKIQTDPEGIINTTYAVKGITDNEISLDVSSKINMLSMNFTWAGNLRVDAKTGLVNKGEMKEAQSSPNFMTRRIIIEGEELEP